MGKITNDKYIVDVYSTPWGMYRKYSLGNNSGKGLGCFLLILAFNVAVGGLLLQYDIHHWASYIQHKQVTVPFLPCAVVGMFTGQFALPVAAITWMLTFIIPGL